MARNPLRSDPTRSATLRRMFVSEFRKRFDRIKGKINRLVVEEDVFGLRPRTMNPFIGNAAFSSTQININDLLVLDTIQRIQKELDPADVLELEDTPHVTVRYGLHTSDPGSVERLLEGHGTVVFSLLGLSLFQNEDADVLKVDVASPRLHDLHHRLGILPHTNTHREYIPHLTIAYLKPGTGAKYLQDHPAASLWYGLVGMLQITDGIAFSPPSRVQTPITLNQRWRFNTDAQKIAEFQKWLQTQIQLEVIQTAAEEVERAYWTKYIEDGYKKGAGRAFDDTRKAGAVPKEKLGFFQGTRHEFLRESFGQPETVEKVKLLAGRVFTDLKGVTDTMAAQMSRVLTDGLVQGKNPYTIARELNDRVEKIGKTRSTVIARTEIIRAHSEGQLDALERLGVTEVGVMVEWNTAGDDRVCPLCLPMSGVVLSIKEARGAIPRHPQCRCAYIPANVGEDKRGQKRSKTVVEKARDTSVRREPGKGTLREKKQASRWPGADLKVDKARPESVLERGKSDALEIGKFRTPKTKPPKKATDPKQPEVKQLTRADINRAASDPDGLKFLNLMSEHADQDVSVIAHGMTNAERMDGVTIDGVVFRWNESETGTRRFAAQRTIRDLAAREDFPQPLWDANTHVIHSSQKNSRDDFWASTYNTPGFVSRATGGDGKIVVYNDELPVGSFAHESGHNLAMKTWGNTHPPANSKYGIAQTLEPPVTPYGANSTSEDFAEACDLYVTQRHVLQRDFPNKYKALKELLGE